MGARARKTSARPYFRKNWASIRGETRSLTDRVGKNQTAGFGHRSLRPAFRWCAHRAAVQVLPELFVRKPTDIQVAAGLQTPGESPSVLEVFFRRRFANAHCLALLGRIRDADTVCQYCGW